VSRHVLVALAVVAATLVAATGSAGAVGADGATAPLECGESALVEEYERVAVADDVDQLAVETHAYYEAPERRIMGVYQDDRDHGYPQPLAVRLANGPPRYQRSSGDQVARFDADREVVEFSARVLDGAAPAMVDVSVRAVCGNRVVETDHEGVGEERPNGLADRAGVTVRVDPAPDRQTVVGVAGDRDLDLYAAHGRAPTWTDYDYAARTPAGADGDRERVRIDRSEVVTVRVLPPRSAAGDRVTLDDVRLAVEGGTIVGQVD
jgi:hypothetical protein